MKYGVHQTDSGLPDGGEPPRLPIPAALEEQVSLLQSSKLGAAGAAPAGEKLFGPLGSL